MTLGGRRWFSWWGRVSKVYWRFRFWQYRFALQRGVYLTFSPKSPNSKKYMVAEKKNFKFWTNTEKRTLRSRNRLIIIYVTKLTFPHLSDFQETLIQNSVEKTVVGTQTSHVNKVRNWGFLQLFKSGWFHPWVGYVNPLRIRRTRLILFANSHVGHVVVSVSRTRMNCSWDQVVHKLTQVFPSELEERGVN